jgi:hypothetical protein
LYNQITNASFPQNKPQKYKKMMDLASWGSILLGVSHFCTETHLKFLLSPLGLGYNKRNYRLTVILGYTDFLHLDKRANEDEFAARPTGYLLQSI